jgi:ribosomal protein L37AE/L43A
MQYLWFRLILLLMQTDPIQEWQRLTEHYREMSDEELRELADDIGNLTDTAKQVLRSEMKSRGLSAAKREPEARRAPDMFRSAASNAPESFDPILGGAAVAFGNRAPEIVPDTPGADDEDADPYEYTWKTLLCECETSEEARQICVALKQVGIESWIEGAGTYSRYTGMGLASPRVLVAADQLEAARAIAAQPILQAIVNESTEVREFVEPKCPKCGSNDVVLEGVDPWNTWRCEQCGEQWTEAAGSEDEEAENTGDKSL